MAERKGNTGNGIELRRSGGMWIARSTGPHAARVRDLFGTVDIPTPFLATAEAGVVLRTIERLNPGVCVTARLEG